MANIVPLVISGAITQATQDCIVLSVVDSIPYYMVIDRNGIPYFQPLYFDPAQGLEVFTNNATRVTVALSVSASNYAMTITSLDKNFPGAFQVNHDINRVVAPGSVRSTDGIIPLEFSKIAGKDNVVACGFQYVLEGDVRFYLTKTWYSNPSSQSVGSIPTDVANNFYVFPVKGVVDSQKQPADSLVFPTLYNDVLGIKPLSFLFSSLDAWNAGAGLPYQYCTVTPCAPTCLGVCNNSYAGCKRHGKDNNFQCVIDVSPRCKAVISSFFLVPAFILMIVFAVIFFRSKKHNARAGYLTTPGQEFAMSRPTKITLAVIGSLVALLIMIMLILVFSNSESVETSIEKTCSVV